MKTLAIGIGLAMVAVFMAGCEWTAGGSVDTWNTSQNGDWADFSGTYKAVDNGVLVRSYAVVTNTATNQVSSQQIGTGDGTTTAFADNLGQTPARGTLTIVVGGYRFIDPGSITTNIGGTVSLTVTPADGAAGTFNFSTTVWSLTFPAPVAAGTPIVASYSYTATTTTPAQANHGKPIYSFVVYQTGNNLRLIDSNAGAYDGVMGAMAGTTNSSSAQASFSVNGVSQGYKVTIVGTLRGTVSGSLLSARTMKATYIEEGGYDGDIDAVAQ